MQFNNNFIFQQENNNNNNLNLFFQQQNQQQFQFNMSNNGYQNNTENVLNNLAQNSFIFAQQQQCENNSSCTNSTNCDSDSDEANSSFNSTPMKFNKHSSYQLSNYAKYNQQNVFDPKKKQQQQNYKTEMCRNWKQTGLCQYRKKCKYAHGEDELKQKQNIPMYYQTRDCKLFYQEGTCPYGTRCLFVHVHKNKMDEIRQSYKAGFTEKLDHGIIEDRKYSRFAFAQENQEVVQIQQEEQRVEEEQQQQNVQVPQSYEEFLKVSDPKKYQVYKMEQLQKQLYQQQMQIQQQQQAMLQQQQQQQQYQNYQYYQYQQQGEHILGMLQQVC